MSVTPLIANGQLAVHDYCQCCRTQVCGYVNGSSKGMRCAFRPFKRGDRLPASEASCMRFWTIVSGTAASCTAFPDGRRQIVQVEMPGDLVCGFSSSSDMESWIEFLSDSVVCEVDLSATAEGLRSDSEFQSRLFRFTHNQLERTALRVVLLGRLDSMERICFFLTEMARRSGVISGNSIRVSLEFSREDIADYLGLNAETVSRLLSRIKKLGLAIFLSPTEYAVPDMNRLERRIPVKIDDSLYRKFELNKPNNQAGREAVS